MLASLGPSKVELDERVRRLEVSAVEFFKKDCACIDADERGDGGNHRRNSGGVG
jgi:hypothetical protein